MAKPVCDQLQVDLGPVIDGLKADLKRELREEMAVENNHRMTGLGKIVPTAGEFSAVEFGLGVFTLPSVTAFASKLAAIPDMLSKNGINPVVSRGVLFVATVGGNILTGGKSFMTGAMVGQIPGLLDALTDWAVSAVVEAKGAPTMKGIGATEEEEELRKLRQELEKLQGIGDRSGDHKEWDMQGLREDDARIRLEAVDSAEGSAEVMEPMTRRVSGQPSVMRSR